VIDLRDGVESGSLNPLDLAARCGTDPAATGRSFAAERIERRADRFWNRLGGDDDRGRGRMACWPTGRPRSTV
jgi:hypothetical protein